MMDKNAVFMELERLTGLEVEIDRYTGNSDKYITFQYAYEGPSEHADDVVLMERTDIQVHLYVPKHFDYMQLKRIIRDHLEGNEFEVEMQTIPDKQVTHIVFECSCEEERMDE